MSWRKALVAVLLLLPVIGLLAFGMGRDPREIPSPLPGRAAPAFALDVMPIPDVADTGSVDLRELRGQVVVLNFFASWCLACRDDHPVLTRVARRYEGKPVRFFGVVYNDKPEDAAAWIERMGGQSYPALLDPGARTAIDYGLYGVPETFVLSRDGRVARKFTGPVQQAALEEELDRLLAEAPSSANDAAAAAETTS